VTDRRRAQVLPQTTYRRPARLPERLDCAWCGERIEPPSAAVFEAHSAFAGVPMPVCPECSEGGEAVFDLNRTGP
jgi:hypothetical protein